MLIIPLDAVPSQTVTVDLVGQRSRINVYQKTTGLFLDLYVNDVLIIGGVLCLNTVLIVRDVYLGFIGDLAFFSLEHGVNDEMGGDPIYQELGTGHILAYIEAGNLG